MFLNIDGAPKPFTLWLFNIAMGNDPFIDGLPINSMVIFHGYVGHNQMISFPLKTSSQ